MAARKERQAAEDSQQSERAKNVKGGRKRQRISKKHAANNLSPNLLVKLPAELRNEIYGLVLTVDDIVRIRATRRKLKPYQTRKVVRVGKREIQSKDTGARSRWTEPGLLRVSKQIRHEAMPVYYGLNFFDVHVPSSKIGNAQTWLQRVAEQCSGEYMSFDLYVKSVRWDAISSWKALAKLAHGLRPHDWYESGNIKSWNVVTYCDKSLQVALEEVVHIGMKACRREQTEELLEEDFQDWALSKARMGCTAGWEDRWSILEALEIEFGLRKPKVKVKKRARS